jgi:hypothetical protein
MTTCCRDPWDPSSEASRRDTERREEEAYFYMESDRGSLVGAGEAC